MAELHTVKITIDAKFQNGLPFDGVLRLRLSRAVNVADGGGVVVPREWQEVKIRADKPETAEVEIIPNALLGEGTFYHYELVQVCNTGVYQYDRYGKRRTAEKGAIVVPDRNCDISELITLPPTDETRETAEAFASEAKQAAAEAKEMAAELSPAVNEVKKLGKDLTSKVDELESEIPEVVAPSENATDKQAAGAKSTFDFINSSINEMAAFYITKDADGNPFATFAELKNAAQVYHAGAVRVPTRHDYCIILADESKTNPATGISPTTRYTYDGVYGEDGRWEYQYKINETALTAAQLAAMNSGVTKEFVETWKHNNPSQFAYKKDLGQVIPKYEFANTAIADGVVTLTPYTNATLTSDGAAFEVAVGGESGYMRDCSLVVDCTSLETAPTISWGAEFHPRTDAETDFACAAGVRNVYWITEYAEGEFAVAGWQETEGGAS